MPLAEDVHDGRYLEALDEALAIVRRFKPGALVVSLGLDIAKADPTGTWSITPDGLAEIGRRIGSHAVPDAARAGGGLQHPLPRPQRGAIVDGGLRGGIGAEGVVVGWALPTMWIGQEPGW